MITKKWFSGVLDCAITQDINNSKRKIGFPAISAFRIGTKSPAKYKPKLYSWWSEKLNFKKVVNVLWVYLTLLLSDVGLYFVSKILLGLVENQVGWLLEFISIFTKLYIVYNIQDITNLCISMEW